MIKIAIYGIHNSTITVMITVNDYSNGNLNE